MNDDFAPGSSLQEQMGAPHAGGSNLGAIVPESHPGQGGSIHEGPQAEVLNELRRLERQLHGVEDKVDKLVKHLLPNG